MNADGAILHVARRPTRLPVLGAAERFRPGDRDRVEQVVDGVKRLGATALRTRVSWAEYHQPGGRDWYAWLMTRLARDLDVLPYIVHPAVFPRTTPSQVQSTDGESYLDFLDTLVAEHGAHFEWVELWCDTDDRNDWSLSLHPDATTICDMAAAAARRLKQSNKRTVLSGLCPANVNWLRLNCERGVIAACDAIGIRASSERWETHWKNWPEAIGAIRGVLDRFELDPELWITEVGRPTWPTDGMGQVDTLLTALEAPVQRVYWHSYRDQGHETASQDLDGGAEPHDHFGLVNAEGHPKLLARLLMQGGVARVRALRRRVTVPEALRAPRVARIGFGRKRAVITGGAGFIGVNLADRIAGMGHQVLIFDNLCRAGVEDNLLWLLDRHRGRVAAEIADVRDPDAAREAVAQADRLFHFAAQVAVTTSLRDPIEDFEVNARGTINLLEGMRRAAEPPGLIYTSSNKVYGALPELALEERAHRYGPRDPEVENRGVSEAQPLDFHSPYGCSKGAADQYVIDFARTYDLPAAVFRMSCIYGPHQRGNEDQGWVAHFLIKALQGGEITIYGDGKQVRDILFVEDLVEAMLLAQCHMPRVRAQAFNIGGGPKNTVSLLELLELIRRLSPRQPTIAYGPARPGDQLYYVSDTRRFRSLTGWRPGVGVEAGVAKLLNWLRAARDDQTAAPQYERSAS